MTYYHGSPTGGLTVLRPHLSEHGRPLVYLSASKPVAAFYLCKRPYMWYTYGFDPDGTPVYTEAFPGQLRGFYGGLPGYLYTCKGDFSVSELKGIPTAAVSTETVPVSACEPVDDALSLLQGYESAGLLRLRHYETLTDEQKEGQRYMVLSTIHHHRLLEGKHPLAPFVRETFPDIWAQALAEMSSRS